MTARRDFNSNPRRRAASLIETLLVVSLNAALMGIAVGFLASMRQAGRTIEADRDDQREISRFVERLRDDLHAADDFEFDANNGDLKITNRPGETVFYRHRDDGSVRRVVVTGEASEQLSDAWDLPRESTWNVDQTANASRTLVRISLHVDSETDEIIIEVGRDQRLLHR